MTFSCCLVAVLAAIVAVVAGEVDKQYGFIPTLPGESCRDIYQKNPGADPEFGKRGVKNS